jgi:hypothetical protein
MVASADRMRALRERTRRGLRRLTMDVSEAISARLRSAAKRASRLPIAIIGLLFSQLQFGHRLLDYCLGCGFAGTKLDECNADQKTETR